MTIEQRTEPVAPISPVVPPAPRRRSGGGLTSILLGVALLFAVGGVSFAAGRLTGTSTVAASGSVPTGGVTGRGNGNNGNGFGNGFGNGLGRGNGNGNGAGFAGGAGLTISGTVTAIASDHLTIRTATGQTIDVPVDSATTYHRQADASAGDLSTGSSVDVSLSGRLGAGVGPGRSPAPRASSSPGTSVGPGSGGRPVPAAADVTITGG
jgi:hypothetical protein